MTPAGIGGSGQERPLAVDSTLAVDLDHQPPRQPPATGPLEVRTEGLPGAAGCSLEVTGVVDTVVAQHSKSMAPRFSPDAVFDPPTWQVKEKMDMLNLRFVNHRKPD